MLKPRAETGGEKKSKPAKPRMVNPRFAAREATKVALFDNPQQRAFDAGKQKGLKKDSKAYKKLETKANQANFKKLQEYYGLPAPKNGKSYSPKEQKRNADTVRKLAKQGARTDKGRRGNALAKSVQKSFPVATEQMFGTKRVASVNKALTRQGAGAKGGGKERKTDRRAVVTTRSGTVTTIDAKGRKTTKVVKNAVVRQQYRSKGKVAKGENARKQTDTRFAGQSAPVGRGASKNAPAKKTPKAEKKQFTKREVKPRFATERKATTRKNTTRKTGDAPRTTKKSAVVGTKPAKAVTTKNTTKATPAPKPTAPKPAATPKFSDAQKAAQQRIVDNAARKKQGDGDFFGRGEAPLTTPKPAGDKAPPIPKDFGKPKKRKK